MCVYDRATFTLFGLFKLAIVPLNPVLLTVPGKLSPTTGHGSSFLNDSGIASMCKSKHTAILYLDEKKDPKEESE